MKVRAQCRQCQWAGTVTISKREWPGKRPAITSVPCPKCKQHKLRRLK